MSVANDTLGKMYPDGPRPTGARGNVRSVNPDETSNVPCCLFAFPFGRRPSVQGARYVGGPGPRVSFATLILPWARFLLGFQPVLVQRRINPHRKSVKSRSIRDSENIGLLGHKHPYF